MSRPRLSLPAQANGTPCPRPQTPPRGQRPRGRHERPRHTLVPTPWRPRPRCGALRGASLQASQDSGPAFPGVPVAGLSPRQSHFLTPMSRPHSPARAASRSDSPSQKAMTFHKAPPKGGIHPECPPLRGSLSTITAGWCTGPTVPSPVLGLPTCFPAPPHPPPPRGTLLWKRGHEKSSPPAVLGPEHSLGLCPHDLDAVSSLPGQLHQPPNSRTPGRPQPPMSLSLSGLRVKPPDPCQKHVFKRTGAPGGLSPLSI